MLLKPGTQQPYDEYRWMCVWVVRWTNGRVGEWTDRWKDGWRTESGDRERECESTKSLEERSEISNLCTTKSHHLALTSLEILPSPQNASDHTGSWIWHKKRRQQRPWWKWTGSQGGPSCFYKFHSPQCLPATPFCRSLPKLASVACSQTQPLQKSTLYLWVVFAYCEPNCASPLARIK